MKEGMHEGMEWNEMNRIESKANVKDSKRREVGSQASRKSSNYDSNSAVHASEPIRSGS